MRNRFSGVIGTSVSSKTTEAIEASWAVGWGSAGAGALFEELSCCDSPRSVRGIGVVKVLSYVPPLTGI